MRARVGQQTITPDAILENERQRRRDEAERLRQAGITPPVLYPIPSQEPSPFPIAEPFRDLPIFGPGQGPDPDRQPPDQTTPPDAPPGTQAPGQPGQPPPGGISEDVAKSLLKEAGIALLLTAPAWIPIFILPRLSAGGAVRDFSRRR